MINTETAAQLYKMLILEMVCMVPHTTHTFILIKVFYI